MVKIATLKEIPLWVKFLLLFKKSRWGFDGDPNVTIVRAKTLFGKTYILEIR